MPPFRKNVKKAAKATSSVDKAQNELMKRMNKKLDELETAVETKYGVVYGNDEMASYDGSTVLTRADQIFAIEIGANQGVSDIERIGDQVTFKHLDFSYRISLPFLRNTEHSQPCISTRVLLFWDSQPSAISTAGGTVVNPVYWPQLLMSCDTGVTTDDEKTDAILSTKDWDQRKRFQIIYDKTHTLSTNGNIGALGLGPRACTGVNHFSKTYVGQKIRYVNGGTIVQNRQLYLAYLSDATIATTVSPATIARRPIIDYATRVLYDDI